MLYNGMLLPYPEILVPNIFETNTLAFFGSSMMGKTVFYYVDDGQDKYSRATLSITFSTTALGLTIESR